MCSTTLAPFLFTPPTPPPSPAPAPAPAAPAPAPAAKNLSLLRLCSHIHEAHQIHALLIKTSQSSDPYFAGRLAEFYALSDDQPSIDDARKLLDTLPQPPVFIFNTLMRAHLNANDPLGAIHLYHQLLLSAQPPNRFSFTFALKACTQLRAFSLGQQLHSQVFERGLAGDPHIRNKLIHLYATFGELVDARKVFDGSEELDIVAWNSVLEGYAMAKDGESLRSLFDSMPVRDVVSWNTVMGFYIENGQFEEAIATFRAIQESGECLPNRVTMINALTAITHSTALGQGKWVHAYMSKQGIEIDDKLGSALINMYSKCGCTEGAIHAFKKTKRKSVDTWNAMLAGFTSNGHSLRCLELFSEMEENAPGVVPNAITFSCVLNACSHGGLVNEGMKLFEKMTDVYGIQPDIGHYGCMVDLFSRAGLFEKVEEIMSQMPMEPDAVMCKSVVAACGVHGNIKLGVKAGYKLIELAPDDNAGYVLLSNIYAKASDYNGVHKARKMMTDRGVRKVPGCSSVELDGVVHEFIAGDASHPRKKEMYAMLDEISDRLYCAGYKPDTEQVLLDIEDEELKESSLSLHSEKLALAFALISTEAGTSIRIVKNLRMCGDCHSAIKLLSRIYDRIMIIRDSSRFHHFEKGSCSCGDYW